MIFAVPAVVLSLLAAFAVQPGADRAAQGTEKVLRERVTQYWEARSKSNLVAAYPFYEPAFRVEFPQDVFLSTFQRLVRFRPVFLGIDRVVMERDGRSARVGVHLRSTPPALNEPLETVTEETWLLMDGVWYHQREPMLPSI